MDMNGEAYRVASWFGIVVLAAAAIIVGLREDLSGATLLLGFLIASLGFVVLEDGLPSAFNTLFVSAAVVNAAGWVWNLYTRIWAYDEFAHFYTTFAATLCLGYLVFHDMPEFREKRWRYLLVITSFGVTLGAWWEVLEWLFLKKLTDPVSDIVIDSLGASLAAYVSVWILSKRSPHRP